MKRISFYIDVGTYSWCGFVSFTNLTPSALTSTEPGKWKHVIVRRAVIILDWRQCERSINRNWLSYNKEPCRAKRMKQHWFFPYLFSPGVVFFIKNSPHTFLYLHFCGALVYFVQQHSLKDKSLSDNSWENESKTSSFWHLNPISGER